MSNAIVSNLHQRCIGVSPIDWPCFDTADKSTAYHAGTEAILQVFGHDWGREREIIQAVRAWMSQHMGEELTRKMLPAFSKAFQNQAAIALLYYSQVEDAALCPWPTGITPEQISTMCNRVSGNISAPLVMRLEKCITVVERTLS